MMDRSTIVQLKQGLEAAFINGSIPSNIAYKPQFISNNYKEGRKVLSSQEESVILNLTNEFPKEEEKKESKNCIFIEKDENGEYEISSEFAKLLKNREFLDMIIEIIDFGIEQYEERFSDRYKDTNFQLYQKYTYEDVCLRMN